MGVFSAIATLHPSALLRDQSMIPAVISDLTKGTDIPPEYYNLAPTIEDLQDFKYKRFALDIETNRWNDQIICVGLCGRPGHAMVVPFQGAYIKELKRIIQEADVIIGHNHISFDMPRLEVALGLEWKPA